MEFIKRFFFLLKRSRAHPIALRLSRHARNRHGDDGRYSRGNTYCEIYIRAFVASRIDGRESVPLKANISEMHYFAISPRNFR